MNTMHTNSSPAYPDWVSLLIARLHTELHAHCGLASEGISALLEETNLPERLANQGYSKYGICLETLAACKPAMDRLSATPQNGWLSAAHDWLAYGLYPSPDQPADLEEYAPALCLYLTALHATIAHEAQEREFDPLTDIVLLTPEEYAESRIEEEYRAYVELVAQAGYVELMHIARECKPFDPLAHTAGVHNVAVHTAREMRACGISTDVALVSAASLSHDIGKFGCRNADAKRIPFLHYFFTDQWLRKNGMVHIAHIAANHSTWDLENENLPAESLVLIYADFRVRGRINTGSREEIEIHTLRDAGNIIFHKLSDVDDVKRRRYALAYQKLLDFEAYLTYHGVNPDIFAPSLPATQRKGDALLTEAETVDAIKRKAFRYSMQLMESVGTSASFERLLERGRGDKNLEGVRTYLNLFEEYFPYMTRDIKLQLLNFLYELLMHHARDVRRQAGQLMGRILGNSGQQYRKELPAQAPQSAAAPALSDMLAECASLWDSFLDLLLMPDQKIEKRHCLRVQNSLKVVSSSLLLHCQRADVRLFLNPFLARFGGDTEAERFFLSDCIASIPAEHYTQDELVMLVDFVRPMLQKDDERESLCALRALRQLITHRAADIGTYIADLLNSVQFAQESISAFLLMSLKAALTGDAVEQANLPVSEVYLNNLKTTVHWVVKVVNVDCLLAYARTNPSEAFHVATHFENLLLVSEHLPVRERAGKALTAIADLLTIEECNEIVVDLCRGLESGQGEFPRFVTPCFAALVCRLPDGQTNEVIAMLEALVRSSNVLAARAALSAFGALLANMISDDSDATTIKPQHYTQIISAIMCGLAHFEDGVHRRALNVLCRDLFGNSTIPLLARRELFMQTEKKLLTILSERIGNELTFFNTAAMLNYLYRMLVTCQVDLGPFVFPPAGPVAFFPGTFDPFSNGHKRIVTEIQKRGFETYLAVDEFTWSKHTQPKLLRRQIVLMSAAGCAGVYLFPDEIPVNIANPADLARLKSLFEGREVYLVCGSDVIEHASAYADPTVQNGAASMNHILFRRSRSESDAKEPSASDRLTGHVIELTLPTYYEDVSSTRIREFVDKNLEISTMIDPVAEAFIRARGLYLRAPQYKRHLRPEEHTYTITYRLDEPTAHALAALPPEDAARISRVLSSGQGIAAIMADSTATAARMVVYGHTVGALDLLSVLGSIERVEYVRRYVSGKMLVIDGIAGSGDYDAAELVNELLTASLSSSHTYALYCRTSNDDALFAALTGKGFVRAGDDGIYMVDMRAPMVITCDAFMMIKEPFASDPEVVACVLDARKRLLEVLCSMFPGELLLAFDTARINKMLIRKVQLYNGVLGLPDTPRRLGPFMCVPYGKILSDVVVPNTVTKTLHIEKVFAPDIQNFTITEAQYYSKLMSQLNTINSFRRSVLLVDDLLHNGYRLEKLLPLFDAAHIDVNKIIVGILSGRGKDLMDMQGRDVDTVYWIPNLKFWFTESLLYPFIGGDSVQRMDTKGDSKRPSINLILPFKMPNYLHGVSAQAKRALSGTALNNTYEILHLLEQRHVALFRRSLSLPRLGEALLLPRMPDRGAAANYAVDLPASAYIRDDIERLMRITEEL